MVLELIINWLEFYKDDFSSEDFDFLKAQIEKIDNFEFYLMQIVQKM